MIRNNNNNRQLVRARGKPPGSQTGVNENLLPMLKFLPYLAPDKIRVKLPYNARVTMTCTSGALAYNIMSGNSVYDPEVTGGGHQALGLDDWDNLYKQYRVLASTLTIDPASVGTTAPTQTVQYTVFPTLQSSVYAASNLDSIGEQYGAKNGIYNNDNIRRLTYRATTMQIASVKRNTVEEDDTFGAFTSASPASQWYWHFYVQPIDLSSTLTMYARTRVVYEVELYGRVLPPAS